MVLLTLKSKRIIEAAVLEFGRDHQRDVWRKELADAPVRTGPGSPVDDGRGPISRDLKAAVVGCLHYRAGQMIEHITNPATSEDDDGPDENDLAEVLGLINWIWEQPVAK